MKKSELKSLIKECLQEILFDSKVIETLMVEVISKVDKLRENTGMSAGAVEAPVASDDVDLDDVEDDAPEDKLAENVAGFWGRALGGDPAFSHIKSIQANGKEVPLKQRQNIPAQIPESAKKVAALSWNGNPVITETNFETEESNVDLGHGSFLGALLNSDKVKKELSLLDEQEEERMQEEQRKQERVANR